MVNGTNRWHLPHITRDLVTYATGIAVAVHEVFFTIQDRQWVLVFAAALMGLPSMWRLDERRRSSNGRQDAQS